MQEHQNSNDKLRREASRKKRDSANLENRHTSSSLQRFCNLRKTSRYFVNSKRGASAESSTLLLSALRPRLASVLAIITGACITSGTISNINNVSAAVSATLTLPDSLSVNANPATNNGFAESSNGLVSVSTGNQAGYTLSIKAKDSTNGSSLVNTTNPNVKLSSITTNLTADQYKNGSYANTWGFKPSSINNTSNTNYVPGPTTEGITIAKTNVNSITAENYTLALATKVDGTTPTGAYSNTFVMTATANEATYNIAYNVNGGSGSYSNTTGDIGSSTYVTIPSSYKPTHSSKDFLGWCTVNPGTSDTCNGVLVQPGGQFPLCKCDLNITLYAMYGTKKMYINTYDGEDCVRPNYSGPAKYYGNLCWMWEDYGAETQQSSARCPLRWHVPNRTDFESLLNSIGSRSQLYNAGWSGNY